MQRAIMIGAGNIGRGFIGALLAKSGYQVLFADVNQSIIDAINEKKQYTVHIKDTICRDFSIQNVRGISSAGEALSQAVCDCDLITTAVGVNVLPIVAKPLAEGLRRRMRAGNKQPLNLIACENAIRATSQLKKAIFSFLNSEEQAFATRFIGFATGLFRVPFSTMYWTLQRRNITNGTSNQRIGKVSVLKFLMQTS